MNLELTEELVAVRDTVREFVDRRLIPLETTLDDLEVIPSDVRHSLEESVREMGFWAAGVPDEFGGGGLGQLGRVVVLEQVSRAVVGDIRDERGFGGNPWPILYSAAPEVRDAYLRAIVEDGASDFFAITEPAAGNDLNAVATRARQDGGDWVINGTKCFITGADRAAFGIVIARTSEDVESGRDLSAFIVGRETPGFEVSPPHRTMGAARTYDLVFESCRVPSSHVVGEIGDGRALIANTLLETRLRQGAYSLGLAQRGLEMAVAYAAHRVTFGRRLIDRGAIRALIGASAGDLRAARLLVYAAAHTADEGTLDPLDVSRAKCLAAEVGSRVLDRAIQIHGGMGLSRELVLERMYRDQRSLRITEGSQEVHKWVIARNVARPRALEAVPA